MAKSKSKYTVEKNYLFGDTIDRERDREYECGDLDRVCDRFLIDV